MKDIKNYEGLYAVTSCGRIWSYISNKFLKPRANTSGYLQVILCKDGKKRQFATHRLVAAAYIPNPNGFDTVDHINGNKKDNYVRNLQWLPLYGNLIKSCPERKKQRVLCVETGDIYESLMDCERALGINHGGVSAVLRGKCKTFKGYHFERVE